VSELTISVGPQHPGSGHFRLIVKLDGDKIVEVIPDPGYVHRGEEKIAEYRNYIQNIPHFERPAIHDSSNILFAYVQAVEDLMNLKIPERGQYIRVIMAELPHNCSSLLLCNIRHFCRSLNYVYVAYG